MEEKKKQIFREKALDRVLSPEQLTDYLHVTNPGVWAGFLVILFMLAGFIAWSFVGTLETVIEVRASVTE